MLIIFSCKQIFATYLTHIQLTRNIISHLCKIEAREHNKLLHKIEFMFNKYSKINCNILSVRTHINISFEYL